MFSDAFDDLFDSGVVHGQLPKVIAEVGELGFFIGRQAGGVGGWGFFRGWWLLGGWSHV